MLSTWHHLNTSEGFVSRGLVLFYTCSFELRVVSRLLTKSVEDKPPGFSPSCRLCCAVRACFGGMCSKNGWGQGQREWRGKGMGKEMEQHKEEEQEEKE